MQYSVVIPTNRSATSITPLLGSITHQTLPPYEIILIVDRLFANQETEQRYRDTIQTLIRGHRHTIVTHHSHDDFVPQQGASTVRNYGFSLARGEYILAIDDDNMLDQATMHDLWTTYTAISLDEQQGVVMPTELYRDTDHIRTQGYSRFHYRLGRVVPEQPVTSHEYKRISFAPSNCLFGPRAVFVNHPLDEALPFIYEDLERTHRLSRLGYPLYALTHVYTHHMMRDKTPLQDSYLADPRSAYYKAKHRILWVRSTATTWQKIQYYLLGLHIHTAALLYKIIRYAPLRQWPSLLSAIIRGTWMGLFSTRS